MSLFSKLKDSDYKLTQRWKKYFIVSVCVILAGIIAAVVFGLATGSPLNIGKDFKGGYAAEVKVGANITDDNFSDYTAVMKDIFGDFEFKTENGKTYSIKLGKILRLGSSTENSMLINYTLKGKNKISAEDTTALADKLKEDIENKLNYMIPDVVDTHAPAYSGGMTFTATYNEAMGAYLADDTFKNKLESAGITPTGLSLDETGRVLTVSVASIFTVEAVKSALTIESKFASTVISLGKTSGTVVDSFIFKALLSVAIAVVLICAYIMIRFEVASGITTILAIIHDLLMVFAFTAIFHITINITFVIALIAVMGVSVAKSVYILSKLRENRVAEINRKSGMSAGQLANKTIIEAILNSKNITIASLLMILPIIIICAIGGIGGVATFLLPVMIGLVVSSFSSLFISPSLWVLLKRDKLGTIKFRWRASKLSDKSAN